ncbi:Acetyl-coenzyme A carboxyl transferase alpha chain [Streptococcus sp. DD13]|nr:Acetyl-coenzyme A carboxyl transferase alpha chain [Streptococcus sp. DD13]
MVDVANMIRQARDQSRLTALDYAELILDDFIELHGDRNFRDDGAVIGGVGFLGEQAVTLVGIQKGKIFMIISTEILVSHILKGIARPFA